MKKMKSKLLLLALWLCVFGFTLVATGSVQVSEFLGGFPTPLVGWPDQYNTFIYDRVSDTLLNIEGARMQPVCPNYAKFSEAQKRLWWAKMLKALTYPESNYKRTCRFVEHGIGDPDVVTGQPNVSEGLLQLSYQDSRYYGCAFDWSEDRHLAHTDSLKTIFDPRNNLECGLKIFEKLSRSYPKKSFFQLGGLYWSTLRSRKSWPGRPSYAGYDKFMGAYEPQVGECF